MVQTSILRLMDSTPTNGEVTNPLGWWSVIISTTAMDALRRTMRRRRREQESFRFREPDGEPAVIFMPTKTGGLSTRAKRGEPTLVVKEGDGPIVPDALMALYICARPREREVDWPIRILGFGRDLAGRHWGVMPLVGRYAGRKGPPTGLSHAYEVSLPDSVGRSFSIRAGDDGRFVGMGDERESILAAEDEAAARSFIAAQRP